MVLGLRRSDRGALFVAAGIVLVGIVFVALSLRRPEPPTFSPTPPEPEPAGERLIGPRIYTVDARAEADWRFFDFSTGSVVDSPAAGEWDLAFRRFHIIANGGDGFAGRAGVADLGAVPFDSVTEVPAAGYQGTAADSTHPAIGRWYDYGFTSHLLSPKSNVYAVRTADGRYAKLEVLGYYCPGARPGCLTFRYAYQGDGSRDVDATPGR